MTICNCWVGMKGEKLCNCGNDMARTICGDFLDDGTCKIDGAKCHLIGIGNCYKLAIPIHLADIVDLGRNKSKATS